MSSTILTSKPMRDAATLTRPAFSVPPDACDSHVHVFESAATYRSVAIPHYTLPDGSLAKLRRMTAMLALQRFVIVQPSYYGTDNRCMLDALDAAGGIARGVAMVGENCTDEELNAMHRRGVRALRLDLFLRSGWPLADIIAYIEDSVRRTQAMGWHVQFYTPGWVVRDLLPFLDGLNADFVIDHMGYMLESDGLTHTDFDRLINVIRGGRGWIKLSAPYRLAKDGNFEHLKPMARAIIEAAPDRIIWGSDWPHIPEGGKDTGALLNLLCEWVPDAAARKRILVSNPARLFRFEE
ncbi:MAG TPA: amidohydrolase family protein [Steroidobacteraceae bacterium]|jgi:predicted TIM-barrel fold metal-dependent hydrolase|nr:amidohydrolase family protein [Steroidobacteraceae bacterium]